MNLKTGLFLALGIAMAAAAERKPPKPAADDQAIRVNVEMVSLPVVVTNRDGVRITNLEKGDFEVFESGVKQEIAGFAATDEPVSVALLLDTSGSTQLQLAKIQNAAIDFVRELHPDDDVAVLSFADDVKLQEDFSIDRSKNEYGIKMTRGGGCTVEYEAVWLGLEEVLKPIKQRKALVLFTDGVDTCSHKASEKETLELSQETQATIYCVYYNTESDLYRRRPGGNLPPSYPPQSPPVLTNPFPPVYQPPPPLSGPGSTSSEYQAGRRYLMKLAENSGGRFLEGNTDLRYAFQEVAKELASQYSIGYYSSDPRHDGKFRNVEVKVQKPGCIARTKKGYYARKEAARR